MSSSESIQKALDQLAAYGLQVESLDTSGTLLRVSAEGDKGRKKSGWYVAHEFTLGNGKTVVVGRFGNWKLSGEVEKFEADYRLNDEDRRALEAKHAADQKRVADERKRANADAAKRAAAIWEKVHDTGTSEYLKRKQVRGFYIGYMRDHLVIPMRTISGKLVGLQFIYNDGDKKYLTGSAKQGAFHIIGDPAQSQKIFILEGYATAASVFEAMQIPCVIAFDSGNLLPVAQAFRKRYPKHDIIIGADDDHLQTCRACKAFTTVETDICTQCGQPHQQHNAGLLMAERAASEVTGRMLVPSFKQPRPLDAKGLTDFNDMSNEQGLPALHDYIEAQLKTATVLQFKKPPPRDQQAAPSADHDAPDPEWQMRIQRNKDLATIANLANTYLFLSNLPEWKGVIAYDEFASRVVCLKPPPYGGEGNRLWSDIDDTRTATWLSTHAGFTAKLPEVQKVVEVVAEDNKFHKVRDYLQGIEWDGTPRVKGWLINYLGALPDIDENASQGEYGRHEQLEQYLHAAGTKWLVGAVARVMRPGCKMDNVLILEGAQGVGKSSVLKILAGEEWFNETMIDLNDKDARQMLNGKWIIELAELDSLNKADNTKAKGFFSTAIDSYRPPYGRRSLDIPRQCVFAGTTNQHEYLRDDVNRRYWPVDCRKINRKALRNDRDQLWAEALQLFTEGVLWWPLAEDKHLFDIEQEKRHIDDPWYEQIADWLDDVERQDFPNGSRQYELTMSEVLKSCLGIEMGRAGERAERIRIGKILYRLGWVKRQKGNGKDRYVYVRGRNAV